MNNETLVTVASVLWNDHKTVEEFVNDATAVLAANYRYYEILLVDNGSTDGTSERIDQLQKTVPNLRLIRLSRHYAEEVAVAASLDNCIGDYVVLIDEGTDPVAMIPAMVDKAASGFHVVIAERTNQKDDFLLRRMLRKPFYWLASKILGFHMHPLASQFRVLSRQAVNSITRVRNKNRSLRYLNALIGYEQAYLPYESIRRGKSSMRDVSLFQSAMIAINMIVSNSAAPLRFASALALLGCFMNLVYFGYILAVSIIKNKVAEGWITTNVSHTSMFLLLFIVLTILSEYIARILEETQDRPLYFVDFESQSTKLAFDPQAVRDRLNVV